MSDQIGAMSANGYNPSYVNDLIKSSGVDTNMVSDGYHTFGELYEHRIVLFIALCNHLDTSDDCSPTDEYHVWKSMKHSDGSEWEGWFIMGIGKEKGKQITYHLPIEKWHQCRCVTVDQAPEWDGHTATDVLERLKNLYTNYKL